MVKRGLLLLFALLLLCVTSLAETLPAVVDECGLFTSEQELALAELIENRIRQPFDMDAVILTSERIPANRSASSEEQTMDFADRYFEDHGYGLGTERSGILYLIDMKNRVSYLSTSGDMIDYISDRRLEQILSSADSYLYEGKYAGAAQAILLSLEKVLKDGVEEGHFRYDAVTGERLTGLYNKLTRGELLIALLAGAGTALAIYGVIASRYHLRGKTYRYDKGNLTGVSLTRDEKTFLRQSVRRMNLSSGGSGSRGGGGGGRGSGVHISSGGGSHGGGGHHF